MNCALVNATHYTTAPAGMSHVHFCSDEVLQSVDTLRQQFDTSKPFSHVIIDTFLKSDVAEGLAACFPKPQQGGALRWYEYNNPIEFKYTADDYVNMPPPYTRLFEYLQSESFLNEVIKPITGYADVEIDPYLHGAGLHYHPEGGKLDMHLDYSIHPRSGMERRVNLIYYLNDTAIDNTHGNGDLLLYHYNKDTLKMVSDPPPVHVSPRFNRAILFRTCDVSWHGMPYPLAAGTERMSVAVYYVSPPRSDAVVVRHKASYAALPEQEGKESPRVVALRNIRAHRRLVSDDLEPGDCRPTLIS